MTEEMSRGLWRAGVEGVGAIFMRSPKILLCKPTLMDRWDRRCVEFAAFWHQHGHGNVPQVPKSLPLAATTCSIALVAVAISTEHNSCS